MMRKAVSHTKVSNNLRSSGCFFNTNFGEMAVIWSECFFVSAPGGREGAGQQKLPSSHPKP